MGNTDRIPTPWRHRWQRFRYRTLPVFAFAACLILTVWLWNRQTSLTNAIGEVEAVRVNVAAGVDGILAPLSRVPWTLFDTVQAKQVVAQLDERLIGARVATCRDDLERLRKEVGAATARLVVSEGDRARGYLSDAARLRCELDQRRLAVLDRRLQMDVDRLELERLTARVEYLKPLYDKKMVAELEFVNEQMLRDVAAKRVGENATALSEAETQQKEAEERLKQCAPLQAADVEKILAPVEAAITTQLARIREVEIEIEMMAIRAPISGTICAIYHWPGENVRAGDPILTIAAGHGRYIVSYLRQEQRMRPAVGATVEVRPHAATARAVTSVVEHVGPQIEPIPLHQCRDPKIPEWGLPVRIALPPEFPARPGELIDVTFKSWSDNGG